MTRFTILFAFSCLISIAKCESAWARNDALLVGGACENAWADSSTPSPRQCPPTEANSDTCDHEGPRRGFFNMFRTEFNVANHALQQNGWNVEIQYGEGNSWERPWPNAAESSRQNLIQALERRIQSLGPGDQFLLNISTHGSPPPVHSICLGDGMFPISELRPYLQRLQARGVRVALIDGSCYSGNSILQFQDAGLCAISTAGEMTTGAIGVSNLFFALGLTEDQRQANSDTRLIPPVTRTGDSVRNGISLSTAYNFAVANLSASTGVIPRTTDCSQNHEDLIRHLDRLEPFLRALSPLLEETSNYSAPANLRTESLCWLRETGDFFSEFVRSCSRVNRLIMEHEITSLGRHDFRLTPFVATLRNDISEFQRVIAQIHGGATDQAVPGGTLFEKAYELKLKIREEIRLMSLMTCLREPFAPSASSCSNFTLFPASRGRNRSGAATARTAR